MSLEKGAVDKKSYFTSNKRKQMAYIFPLTLLLAGLCLYHAYQNKSDQMWFWLIIFLPFIGSVIYAYVHFFNRRTIDTVAENVTQVTNSNYQIEKLEKAVAFSGTVANKTALADEYLKIGAYEKSHFLYKSCLKGTHADDHDLLMGLIKTSYLNKDYQATVDYAAQLENEKIFEKSEERIAYAWALFQTGDHRKTEEIFESMNHQFSNYRHRVEYSNFLIQEQRLPEAKELLDTLVTEIDHMERAEKRSNQAIYTEIKKLRSSI